MTVYQNFSRPPGILLAEEPLQRQKECGFAAAAPAGEHRDASLRNRKAGIREKDPVSAFDMQMTGVYSIHTIHPHAAKDAANKRISCTLIGFSLYRLRFAAPKSLEVTDRLS